MSRPRGYAAGKRHERVVQLFVTLLTMVIADWRKLVAEVSHAFRRKARSSRGEQT